MRIAELAERQYGVVSRRQLAAVGAGEEAIRHRLEVRRLHRVHAGVYALGLSELTLHGRYLAAVLACGSHAALSHRSAAALWDLLPIPAGPIDVTIPRGGSRRQPGIAMHTSRRLTGSTARCKKIPCTTPERTLVDLAAVITPRRLSRVLEQSLVLRLFDGTVLAAELCGGNGRRGTGTLRRLLSQLEDQPPFTRRELERRFLELVRKVGLPAPIVNAIVAGYEVDFHWPSMRLIVETDGRATHATVIAFERDRRRDLELTLAGWHVVRLTWRQVVYEPEPVIALLRARLA